MAGTAESEGWRREAWPSDASIYRTLATDQREAPVKRNIVGLLLSVAIVVTGVAILTHLLKTTRTVTKTRTRTVTRTVGHRQVTQTIRNLSPACKGERR